MKIFYPLEAFYPSQAGGPANTVYWITKALKKRGFEPIVVSTDLGLDGKLPTNTWLETDGGKAIFVRTKFQNYTFSQTLVSLFSFFRADVVHLSSIFLPTCFVTGFAARMIGRKIVWSARGELDTPTLLSISQKKKRVILWLVKKLIGTFPVFHTTCDAETGYVRNAFGDDARIVQIANYIEVPAQVKRTPSQYLLAIGRVHPKKALENLIQAVAASDEFMRSDFVLKIAGRGNKTYENSLIQLVRELDLGEKVLFVGQVEGHEKQQLLADAHFMFMPSHTENFGNVVLESLAQETPVVASTASPWKSLGDEKIGFWIDNSVEDLRMKVDEILYMDDIEYKGYRDRARQFVMREFDIEKNIEKWIDVYEDSK